MKRPSPSSSVTSVTRLTSLAPAAIAVIELRGPQALEWTMACWESATQLSLSINAIRYGRWRGQSKVESPDASINGTDRADVEETLSRSLRRPTSPNGRGNGNHSVSMTDSAVSEDIVVCQTDTQTVELHCHGGKMAAKRIVEDLIALGAMPRDATGSEVSDSTLRFLSSNFQKIGDRNKAIEEIERTTFAADAWEDLLKTTTPRTTAMMLDQAQGALDRAVHEIHDSIEQSEFEVANHRIDLLCSRYVYGLHLTQPWKLAITGPPNVGKSSLLNAILGFDRAIVDASAGTTRDILNERTSLLGWPFEILDTAGLRDTHNTIEAEGVRRAIAAIEESDMALCVVDPMVGWTDLHQSLKRRFENKLLFLVSKADLVLTEPLSTDVVDAIRFSSVTKVGMAEMYEAIVKRLIPVATEPGIAIPFRSVHMAYLDRLRASMHPM